MDLISRELTAAGKFVSSLGIVDGAEGPPSNEVGNPNTTVGGQPLIMKVICLIKVEPLA